MKTKEFYEVDLIIYSYFRERKNIIEKDFSKKDLKFKNKIYNYEFNSLVNYIYCLVSYKIDYRDHDYYCRSLISSYL